MFLVSVLVFSVSRGEPFVINRSGGFSAPADIMASHDVDHPAIAIRGDGLVVDFGNRPIRGTSQSVDPDKREGTGVVVEGNNITIRHAKISGYKVAVMARGVKGLRLLDCDFSYNWKQHLKSTPEKEDGADWMSYHSNEKDEWLHTYAGAVYLHGCEDFELKNVTVTGGQCGLMMTQCKHGLVWNSNFSFLSGLGIGMYRSSDNRIMHNKIDWCVRGHSEGVYNRGQDSAGILVYEQSNRNVFAYNSVTHGGDGFFLWAGQSSMDTGEGGCNDNLVYGNDFSSAPANGIEATFSRNAFVNNKLIECWHGIWGGYSFDTKILGNAFAFNGASISIEHGQANTISSNSFWRDNLGIELWAAGNQDPNWGYPKHRDTKSRDYTIADNFFGNVAGQVLSVRDTHGLIFEHNRLDSCSQLLPVKPGQPDTNEGLNISNNKVRTAFPTSGDFYRPRNQVEVDPTAKPMPAPMQPGGLLVAGIDQDSTAYAKRFDVSWDPFGNGDEQRKEIESLAPQPLKGGQYPFLIKGQLRGRRYIHVDEWGPYDFRRPILFASRPTDLVGKTQKFDILGPKGKWRVLHVAGAVLGAQFGDVPGTVEVTIPSGKATSVEIELEYKGGTVVDYRGIETKRGMPVPFGFTKFIAPIQWDVKFFRWTESVNAAEPHAVPKDIARVFAGKPILVKSMGQLDLAGGSLMAGLPNDHYATLAEGSFTVPVGDYVLELTTDDGARVLLDGREVIGDAWHYQGPTGYRAELHLDGSVHRIRVEHFQIDGYAALKVDLRPKR